LPCGRPMVSGPEFSILLLTYTRPDLLEQRLREIATLCPVPGLYEVVVGDNGSPNREASLVVATFQVSGPAGFPVRPVRISPNAGFGRGFNALMEHARGEYWACLSDDVRVTGDLIAELKNAFRNAPGGLVCQRIIDWPAGWNQFADTLVEYPEGYFLAAHRDVWGTLGYFDPRFYPNDYEDVDLGRTAWSKGVPLVPWPSLPLVHTGAQTVGHSPERFRQTIAMRAVFAEKWALPNIPERP